MRVIKSLIFQLRTLFSHNLRQDDLDEEIRSHIDMLTEDFLVQGMDREQARRRALKEFGYAEGFKEDCRDVWGVRFLADTYRDTKYGLKLLAKTKGFTAICIATLCFCIAANTAFLSLAHNLLIRPYDFPNPERVINIGMQHLTSQYGEAVLMMSPRSYLDIEEGSESFVDSGLLLFNQTGDLELDGAVSTVRYSFVTPGMWNVASVRNTIGRVFDRDDLRDGNQHLAVLSDRMWKQHFDRNPEAIGAVFKIDGQSYEVIGVMPQSFTLTPLDSDLWIPFAFHDWHRSEQSRNYNSFLGFARLRDGVSIEQVQSELDAIYSNAPIRKTSEGETVDLAEERYAVIGAADYGPQIVPATEPIIWSTQGAFFAILLVGCLNVGGLILVKNMQRLGELEMRHALGASKSRLYRQLLTETLILFAIAGVLSFPVSKLALLGLDAFVKNHFPQGIPTDIDLSVLATVIVSVLTIALIFGSLPTLRILRNRLNVEYGSHTSSASLQVRWTQNAFVIALVSISSLLLVFTGTFFNKISNTTSQDFGYSKEQLTYANITLPQYLYKTQSDVDAFHSKLTEKLSTNASIKSLSISSSHPLSFELDETTFEVVGYTPPSSAYTPHGNAYTISEGHFDTLGIQLLQGRDFNRNDSIEGAAHTVIVSESVVRDHLQGREAIGSKIVFRGYERTIIGVVNDTIDYPFHMPEPRHSIYLYKDSFPHPVRRFCFALKTSEGSPDITPMVQQTISELDPLITRVEVMSVQAAIQDAILFQLIPAELAFGLSLTAILLSMLGLYGAVSYTVHQKRRGMAIRASLGASSRKISQQLYLKSAKLSGTGLAIGLISAYLGLKAVAHLFPQEGLSDPSVFLTTALLIAGTSALATYLPSRKAQKTELMEVLRSN